MIDAMKTNKQNTTYLAVGDMDTVHYSTLTFCLQSTKRKFCDYYDENENTHTLALIKCHANAKQTKVVVVDVIFDSCRRMKRDARFSRKV